MSCPYPGKCSDKDIKCTTCIHGDRSYYVEYHEYPPDKLPIIPREIIGDDLRYQTSDDLCYVTGYWENTKVS